jgi:hypothetical protein
MSGPEADRTRKKIIKVFQDNGLQITIEANLKCTDFLDVTFDLTTGKYYPFRKPNDTPLYIHAESNHPPNIVKQLPLMISRRTKRHSETIACLPACLQARTGQVSQAALSCSST